MRSSSILALLKRPWESLAYKLENKKACGKPDEIGQRIILRNSNGTLSSERTATWLVTTDEICRIMLAVRCGDPGEFLIWAETRELDRYESLDLWRNSLACFPSSFERLIYFASKRHPSSGNYIHDELAKVSDSGEVHRRFKEAHERTFDGWLSFNLEQKNADVRLYLATLHVKKSSVMQTWVGLEPLRNLIPAAAREAERMLFISDLQALIELIKAE